MHRCCKKVSLQLLFSTPPLTISPRPSLPVSLPPLISLLRALWLTGAVISQGVLDEPRRKSPKVPSLPSPPSLWQQESEGRCRQGSEPATWRYWCPTPAHRSVTASAWPWAGGSAAIMHGSLMLLMRKRPPRRPARPWGVATQCQTNLSWQTSRSMDTHTHTHIH